jgi:hypothetical protein
MSYAVQHYFLNGGTDALIVRFVNGTESAAFVLPPGKGANDLRLEASSEGSWGDNLRVSVDYDTFRSAETDRTFNLLVTEVDPSTNEPRVAEAFRDLSIDAEAARYVGKVLREESALLRVPDPLQGNRLEEFVPCGVVAGIFARIDARRGVWKAPAGTEATLTGVRELVCKLNDGENGTLNALGVNCLRTLPAIGNVLWGARTLEGADRLASQWKYVCVRRLALFLEESLYRGTKWAVFEPNDEPTWARIRLGAEAFMHRLFLQGAFQGTTPREAYFVRCDGETTTQNERDRGIMNVVVGFAPLKPAEFVLIKIQQIVGQSAV